MHSLILDSPFEKLETPINNIIQQKTGLSQTLSTAILYFIKSQVEKKLAFNLFEINYLEKFRKFSKSLPVLLLYSNEDETVPATEVKKYFNASKG